MKAYKKVINILGILFIIFVPNWIAGSRYAGSNLIYYLGIILVVILFIVNINP